VPSPPLQTGAPLTEETLLEIQGPDACRFLQGQVTCDVQRLPEGQHTLGACCDNKGRMLATFRIAKASPERLLLRLPQGVAKPLLDHLARYKVFFKCEMTILDTWSVWAFWPRPDNPASHGSAASSIATLATDLATRGSGIAILQPGSARFEIWLPTTADLATTLFAAFATTESSTPELSSGPATPWYRQEFRAGIGRVLPQTIGRFVPQQLNLQALDAISFKKGCYTGQEIVARMHYLGKVKRSMHLLRGIASVDPATIVMPAPGGSLHTASGPIGEVVDALREADRFHVLAVMDNERASDTPVYLDAEHRIAVDVLPLPCTDPD